MVALTNAEYLQLLNLIYLANSCEEVGGFARGAYPRYHRPNLN